MNPHLNAVIAAERQHDLERAAGCCPAQADYRRTLRRRARGPWAFNARRRDLGAPPAPCC